jgi:hypothetical protein
MLLTGKAGVQRRPDRPGGNDALSSPDPLPVTARDARAVTLLGTEDLCLASGRVSLSSGLQAQ